MAVVYSKCTGPPFTVTENVWTASKEQGAVKRWLECRSGTLHVKYAAHTRLSESSLSTFVFVVCSFFGSVLIPSKLNLHVSRVSSNKMYFLYSLYDNANKGKCYSLWMRGETPVYSLIMHHWKLMNRLESGCFLSISKRSFSDSPLLENGTTNHNNDREWIGNFSFFHFSLRNIIGMFTLDTVHSYITENFAIVKLLSQILL